MLSLQPKDAVSLTFTQLSGVDGLHLLRSLRGILPIGPNGVPGFDTVPASSFKDAMTAPDLFYNYTLELQGVFSNVTCAYTYNPAAVPINYTSVQSFVQYNGTCPPGQDILSPALYLVPRSNSSLAFWACKTGGDLYTLYIVGGNYYEKEIGNITCNVAPFQPALFPLTYTGQSGVFAVQNPVSTWPNTSTQLLTRAIKGLGATIDEAQGIESNLLAESVFSIGVKFFGLQPYVQNETYLRLYEAMIQGILDYQVCPIRCLPSPLMLLIRPHTSVWSTQQKSTRLRQVLAYVKSTALRRSKCSVGSPRETLLSTWSQSPSSIWVSWFYSSLLGVPPTRADKGVFHVSILLTPWHLCSQVTQAVNGYGLGRMTLIALRYGIMRWHLEEMKMGYTGSGQATRSVILLIVCILDSDK